MQHDWKAFGDNITALLKTSGDSGDSGDKSKKRSDDKGLFVPTSETHVSPLENEWGQPRTPSGDSYFVENQQVNGGVPTVSTVPTHFWEDIFPDDVPVEWREGFASFSVQAPPVGYPEHRWKQGIEDSRSFLVRWGAEAARLGWSATDLFGASPIAPWPRVGMLGLIPLLNGDPVVALSAGAAVIESRSGARLSYQRHIARDGRACLWVIGGAA